MTNEQTHILMKQMCARLLVAIEDARGMLPEAQREMVTKHISPNCNGMMCLNSSHLQTVPGDFPLALIPLRVLLEEWEGQARLLATPEQAG